MGMTSDAAGDTHLGSGRAKKVSSRAVGSAGAEASYFGGEGVDEAEAKHTLDAFHGFADPTEPSLISVKADDVASADTAGQLQAKLNAVQQRAREQAKTIAALRKT